jgi:hypothetical protein
MSATFARGLLPAPAKPGIEYRSQSYSFKVKGEKVTGKTKRVPLGIIKKAREQCSGCGSARLWSALARAVTIQVFLPLPALCI